MKVRYWFWIVLLLAGCNSPRSQRHTASTTGIDARLSALAADQMRLGFHRLQRTSTVSGSQVQVQGHTLDLSVRQVQTVDHAEGTLGIVEVSLALNGQDLVGLRTISSAIDRSPNDALERAVREWGVASGLAILDGFNQAMSAIDVTVPPDPPPIRPVTMGNYSVFAGPEGVRGEDESTQLWRQNSQNIQTQLSEQLRNAITTVIPPEQSRQIHGIRVGLSITNGVVDRGECAVDYRSSPVLCDALESVPWPRTESTVVYKRYWVLFPAGYRL